MASYGEILRKGAEYLSQGSRSLKKRFLKKHRDEHVQELQDAVENTRHLQELKETPGWGVLEEVCEARKASALTMMFQTPDMSESTLRHLRGYAAAYDEMLDTVDSLIDEGNRAYEKLREEGRAE